MNDFANHPFGFDKLRIGLAVTTEPLALSIDDIRMFHQHFAPYMPLGGGRDFSLGDPPAAQAHLYAVWTRLLFDKTRDWPVISRLEQDAVRYFRPVYAGDRIRLQIRFVAKEEIDDDRGLLIAQHDLLDENEEIVMSIMTRTMMKR